MTGLDTLAVRVAAALRREGVAVTTQQATTYLEALAALDVQQADAVYWAGRAALTTSPDHIAAYDRAFHAVFGGDAKRWASVEETITVVALVDDEGGDADALPLSGAETVPVRYSPTEILREKDFAAYSADEFAEAHRLMDDLRLVGALRRSRRRRPSSRTRGAPDLRRTLRRAMRTGGDPVRRAFFDTSARPRRVVLLCDISGSMDPYARSLLRFVHAGVAAGTRVEAFALGTRLTRISRELADRDPDAALAAAARTVADWSGGTRLGAGLRAFNDEWGVRGMARGSIVVILSDGWDRGDPAELAAELARLKRVAHRIVWVNPLKASPGYAPLARGMAAALPFIDEFVEGHSLAAMEELVEVVGRR
jgi:uncharacterized protein with von Willebrand factor type A (vWA) domain